MSLFVRSGGSFCDVVARAGGGYAFVYLAAGRLICERVDGAGVPVMSWSVLAPSMSGLYLRAASGPEGQVACAYQGQNGTLYVSIDGSPLIGCGGTFGGHVVGLYWQDGFRAIVQRTPTNLQRITLPGAAVLENIAIPGTSQGIRDVRPDGSFVLSDVGRVQTVAGWTLHDPMTRGEVTVGQTDAGIAVVRPVGGFTAILGDAFEPHLALDGDVVLVSARTPHGATLARFLPPYPNVEAPPMPAIGRPCWLGFYNFQPAHTPGNCVLNVSDGIVRDARGAAIAQYVAGTPDGDVDALDRAIAAAKPNGLPVVAYWTRQAQAIRVPKGADIVGVEAYRLKDETVAAFEARVRTSVARCERAALIAQCYSSNANNTTDLASVVPVVARIAKARGNVWGVLAFSGYGRASGLQDHPEVLPLWNQLSAGIPSAPAAEVFMAPWRVKFDESYTKTIARGAGAVARCAIGNGVEVEWQKGANDAVCFAVYKDGVLQDRSDGTARHVNVVG